MDKEMQKITEEEFAAISARCRQLAETEKLHPGLVIDRCNGTMKSTRKFFRKYFKGDKEKVERCIGILESHGGFCNCEILFNVMPNLDVIQKKCIDSKSL